MYRKNIERRWARFRIGATETLNNYDKFYFSYSHIFSYIFR